MKSVGSVESARSVGSVKSVESARSVGSVKSVESVGSAGSVKLVESVGSVGIYFIVSKPSLPNLLSVYTPIQCIFLVFSISTLINVLNINMLSPFKKNHIYICVNESKQIYTAGFDLLRLSPD